MVLIVAGRKRERKRRKNEKEGGKKAAWSRSRDEGGEGRKILKT